MRGVEQLRPSGDHLVQYRLRVDELVDGQSHLLQGAQLRGEQLQTARRAVLGAEQARVVDGEGGELRDGGGEGGLLLREEARLAAVVELDDADDLVPDLERHRHLQAMAVGGHLRALLRAETRVGGTGDEELPRGHPLGGHVVLGDHEPHADAVGGGRAVGGDAADGLARVLDHVDVALVDLKDLDEAHDHRLQHVGEVEARGEAEARFDDEGEVVTLGLELVQQAGVVDGDGGVAGHRRDEAQLLLGQRLGARRDGPRR